MTNQYKHVYVKDTATVSGPYESKGPLKNYFDRSYDDLYNGEDTWEKAEVKLMQDSIDILLEKANRSIHDVDLMVAGDLLNQITSSCYAAKNMRFRFLEFIVLVRRVLRESLSPRRLSKENKRKM